MWTLAGGATAVDDPAIVALVMAVGLEVPDQTHDWRRVLRAVGRAVATGQCTHKTNCVLVAFAKPVKP